MLERMPYARWIGSSLGQYRLDQVLGRNELGALFSARNLANNSACLVRALGVPPAQTPQANATYAERLQEEASPIAGLQHPYILPLIDYGVHGGQPYLVWPGLVMRSLITRLSQSGPVDVVTVGRYIDQIAAALEAAHQQGIVHRNLSAEGVFIHLDGHLLVADFGVRRLVELLGAQDGRAPFYGSLEACAPEQLSDGRVGPYTDVYALGALTYRLLTGRPVFMSESAEATLQQHLYARPAPLRALRAGLPSGLEGVLETALAKDPSRRFPQPGAFANAYHQVVAPNSMTRVAFTASPALDTARPRSTPSDPTRAPDRRPTSGLRPTLAPNSEPEFDLDLENGSISHPLGNVERGIDDGSQIATFERPARRRLSRLGLGSGVVAVALVIIVIANGLFLFGGFSGGKGGASPASGNIEFLDSASAPAGSTDSVRIVVRGVSAPSAGHAYYAWIINQANEQVVPLGHLTLANQTYSLRYTSPDIAGKTGVNVLSLGDKIEVTLEQSDATVPVGKVILSAAFPPQAFVHIGHLLLSFPTTPGKIGLLVGVLNQTQEVAAQGSLLQNAASSGNTASVQCGAQSILDIIEGAHGPHYRPLDQSCQALNISLIGDGFGLVDMTEVNQGGGATGSYQGTGYLDGAGDHASLAATVPDATATIKLHAQHVETAIANIKGWLVTADQDAVKLLATPGSASLITDLITSCDHAYHGVNADTDQTIDPTSGEGGAVTAYEHGQFMATLTLASAA